MNLLNLSKGSKSFGYDVIFENASFTVYDNDKIGFVGVNGAGKTTLFRILTDDLSLDEGTLFINNETKIGYLKQHAELKGDKTVWDELMSVFSHIIETEKRLDEIALKIELDDGDIDELVNEQTLLTEEFERADGFTYKSRARSALIGLGFTEKEFDLNFTHLSGGQKTRLMLCKILLGNSNLLLLDEPTNHLDIQSVEWLEGFLKDYKGAYIIISHDRYFLDKVTNKTFELEGNKLTAYNGNYTTYRHLKEEALLSQTRTYENTKKEIERLEGVVAQQRQWNREKNIKTAESKLKVIKRLESTLSAPTNEPGSIRFRFEAKAGGGNDVLTVENLAMAFGAKKLFENADMFIKKAEKIFLLGANGCGKTTLLRILLGEIEPTNGIIKLGSNITIGYYDQSQANLNYNGTVFDEISDAYPKMTQTEIRSALAAFLFTGDDVFKDIATLSGGERARVNILKLMLSGANFLILDEPTNHLDISSREALETALSDYDGTLLMVSHDRYFINKLADRIYHMSENEFKMYQGGYDYYLEKSQLYQQTQAQSAQVTQTVQTPDAPLSGGDLYKAKKALEAQKRKIANRIVKIEAEIEAVETHQKELNDLLLTDEYATDPVKATELYAKIEEDEEKLLELYEEYETLQSEE